MSPPKGPLIKSLMDLITQVTPPSNDPAETLPRQGEMMTRQENLFPRRNFALPRRDFCDPNLEFIIGEFSPLSF